VSSQRKYLEICSWADVLGAHVFSLHLVGFNYSFPQLILCMPHIRRCTTTQRRKYNLLPYSFVCSFIHSSRKFHLCLVVCPGLGGFSYYTIWASPSPVCVCWRGQRPPSPPSFFSPTLTPPTLLILTWKFSFYCGPFPPGAVGWSFRSGWDC
jgi:hypothetical protein